MDKLIKQERIRYSRHQVVENFGLHLQAGLKNAKAAVIGAGVVCSLVLLCLAAVGVV